MEQHTMARNRTRYTVRVDNRLYEITVNSRTKHCGVRFRENSSDAMSMPVGNCLLQRSNVPQFLVKTRDNASCFNVCLPLVGRVAQ